MLVCGANDRQVVQFPQGWCTEARPSRQGFRALSSSFLIEAHPTLQSGRVKPRIFLGREGHGAQGGRESQLESWAVVG